jgi:hypothetical protein
MLSRIYKLTSQQTPKIYIGSTKLSLNTRFILHKTKFKNQVKYITANELLQHPDCKIELIEECYLNTDELKRKEGEYIKHFDTCNKNIAGRNLKQYYKDNLAKYKETNKKFRTENPEYYNKYYQVNKNKYNVKIQCDCGGKYCTFTKSNHFKTNKHIKYLASLTGNVNN